MITPTFEVQIWDANDELYRVRLFTLMTWEHTLRLKVKSGMNVTSTDVEKVVREELSIPRTVPLADISQHITDSYNDIKKQLGLAS